MKISPKRPAHCEGCPSYNSNPSMSFSHLQLREKEAVDIGDTIIHILYLLKGRLLVTTDSLETYVIPENHFFLVSQHQKFTLAALDDAELISQDIIYPFNVCEQTYFDQTYAECLGQIRDSYRFTSLEIRKPLLDCIWSIEFAVQDGMLCDHLIFVKMQEVFLYYKHYYTTLELGGLLFPVFDRQMEFYIKVTGAVSRAHSVKQLAELAGYSLPNFKVHFKVFFGDTPYKWMIKRKLKLLRKALMDDHIPLKIIVDDFGFSDQSHLNNFCKRHMGGTASQVRKGILNPQELSYSYKK